MGASRYHKAIPARVSLAFMTAAGVMVLYMLRINLSVAIVAMVETPIAKGEGNSSAPPRASCLRKEPTPWLNQTREGQGTTNNTTHAESYTDLPLDEQTGDRIVLSGTQKGLILGAFFYGYIFTNIPGGRLAEVYGTKRVFGGSMLMSSLLTLGTPLATHLHYSVLIVLRMMIGLCQGVVYPALHVMVARWIPPLERPRFMSFTYMANCVGLILTMPACGFIIDAVGWPTVFYASGSVSLVWVVLWFALMHDSPERHPRISPEERRYILEALGKDVTVKPKRTPWRGIMTNLPLWSINMAHVGAMFGFTLLMTHLPSYMSSVLGFSIKSNGLLSALPFLTQFLGSNVCGLLGDFLLTRGYITVLTSRKIFTTVSLVFPAAVLVAVGYVGCNSIAAVAIFPVGTAFAGAICSGYLANHHDLSPNFAGTIYGVTNTIAFGVGMCVPVVVGAMTPDQSLDQWQAVFWVSAAMYLGTWLFYVVFASSDIQPWNSDGGEREKGVNGVENNHGEEELESLNKTKDEA